MSYIDVLDYTFPTARVFSTSERVALSTSLPLLAEKIKVKNLLIWGKLCGYNADYIIVQAYTNNLIEEPELYYSVDGGLTFTLLGTTSSLLSGLSWHNINAGCPIGDDGVAREELKIYLLNKMRGPFVGDPAYEYRIASDDDNNTEREIENNNINAKPHSSNGDSKGSDANSKTDKTKEDGYLSCKSYKESVRLALFIDTLDYIYRVAPRGAYCMTTSESNKSRQIRRNDAFSGLRCSAATEALSLYQYYHIRAHNPYRKLLDRQHSSQHCSKLSSHEKSDVEKMAEHPELDAMFESIADDEPAGLWQLHFDPANSLVIGRHAQFEGALFYHVLGTNKCGNIYMGDGVINQNVSFQL